MEEPIFDTLNMSVLALSKFVPESVRAGMMPAYALVLRDDADVYLKDPDWMLIASNLTVRIQRPTIESATTGAVVALRAEAQKLQAETGKRLTEIDRKINQLLAITNEVSA